VTSWRTAVFAAFSLNGIANAAIISRAPTVRELLHIGIGQFGLLILAASIGSIVGLVLSSHIVHLLGGRRTILIALGLCGLAIITVGAGTAIGSYALAVVGMALFGFGSAVCDVAMNVEGGGVERAGGRAIMPWFHASWSLGTVVSAGLGSLAAFAGVSPLLHFTIIGIVVAIGAVIATRWLPGVEPPSDDDAPRPTFRDRMSIWIEPRTLLIGLIVLGMAFTEGSANDWLALGFHDDRGLDAAQAALVYAVFTTSMTLGRIAGVPLLNRFGRVAALRGAAIAALVGLATVILVPIVPIGVVVVVVWGVGASLGFPVGMSAASDGDPAKAAARVSTVATIAYGAFLIGPPLIGFVGQQIGLLHALWIVFGLVALSIFAIPAARERTKA